ncbi:MAG: hypothetical protein ACLFPX_05640 [Candidatus Omnitrophota bacterium]
MPETHRPAGLTVLAVLNFIFGGITLIFGVMSMTGILFYFLTSRPEIERRQIFQEKAGLSGTLLKDYDEPQPSSVLRRGEAEKTKRALYPEGTMGVEEPSRSFRTMQPVVSSAENGQDRSGKDGPPYETSAEITMADRWPDPGYGDGYGSGVSGKLSPQDNPVGPDASNEPGLFSGRYQGRGFGTALYAVLSPLVAGILLIISGIGLLQVDWVKGYLLGNVFAAGAILNLIVFSIFVRPGFPLPGMIYPLILLILLNTRYKRVFESNEFKPGDE